MDYTNNRSKKAADTLQVLSSTEDKKSKKEEVSTEDNIALGNIKAQVNADKNAMLFRVRGRNQLNALVSNRSARNKTAVYVGLQDITNAASAAVGKEVKLEIKGNVNPKDIALYFTDELSQRPELVQATGVVNHLNIFSKEAVTDEDKEKELFKRRGTQVKFAKADIVRTVKEDGKTYAILKIKERNVSQLNKHITDKYALSMAQLTQICNNDKPLAVNIVDSLLEEVNEKAKKEGYDTIEEFVTDYQKATFSISPRIQVRRSVDAFQPKSDPLLVNALKTTTTQLVGEKLFRTGNIERNFPELAEDDGNPNKKGYVSKLVTHFAKFDKAYKKELTEKQYNLVKGIVKGSDNGFEAEHVKSTIPTFMLPSHKVSTSFDQDDRRTTAEADDAISRLVAGIHDEVNQYNESKQQYEDGEFLRDADSEIQEALSDPQVIKNNTKLTNLPYAPEDISKLRFMGRTLMQDGVNKDAFYKTERYKYEDKQIVKLVHKDLRKVTEAIISKFQLSAGLSTSSNIMSLVNKVAKRAIVSKGTNNPVDQLLHDIIDNKQTKASPFTSAENAHKAFLFINKYQTKEERVEMNPLPISLMLMTGVDPNLITLSRDDQFQLGYMLASNNNIRPENAENIILTDTGEEIGKLIKEGKIEEATKLASNVIIQLETAANTENNAQFVHRFEPNEPAVNKEIIKQSAVYQDEYTKLSKDSSVVDRLNKQVEIQIKKDKLEYTKVLNAISNPYPVEIYASTLKESDPVLGGMSDLLEELTSTTTEGSRAINEIAEIALQLKTFDKIEVVIKGTAEDEVISIPVTDNDTYGLGKLVSDFQEKEKNNTLNDQEVEALKEAEIKSAITTIKSMKEFVVKQDVDILDTQSLKQARGYVKCADSNTEIDENGGIETLGCIEKQDTYRLHEKYKAALPELVTGIVKQIKQTQVILDPTDEGVKAIYLPRFLEKETLGKLKANTTKNPARIDVNVNTNTITTNRIWQAALFEVIDNDIIYRAKNAVESLTGEETGINIISAIASEPATKDHSTNLVLDTGLKQGFRNEVFLGEDQVKKQISKNFQGRRIIEINKLAGTKTKTDKAPLAAEKANTRDHTLGTAF